MITADTLTVDQVDRLETEAGAAGDLEMAKLCRLVVSHWNRTVVQGRTHQPALRAVLRALNDAAAQRDE